MYNVVHIIITTILSCVTIALASVAVCQGSYNLWRFGHSAARKRTAAHSAIYGTWVEIIAKSALVLMEIVTVLFLARGVTPVDILLMFGLHVPVDINRYLLLYGSQIQVILGTSGFIYLNHYVKSCHFPRESVNEADGVDSADGVGVAEVATAASNKKPSPVGQPVGQRQHNRGTEFR
jgi:hypothetical protein